MPRFPWTMGLLRDSLNDEIENNWKFNLGSVSEDVRQILSDLNRWPDLRITPEQCCNVRDEAFGNLLPFVPENDALKRFYRVHLFNVFTRQCQKAGVKAHWMSGYNQLQATNMEKPWSCDRVFSVLIRDFSRDIAKIISRREVIQEIPAKITQMHYIGSVQYELMRPSSKPFKNPSTSQR